MSSFKLQLGPKAKGKGAGAASTSSSASALAPAVKGFQAPVESAVRSTGHKVTQIVTTSGAAIAEPLTKVIVCPRLLATPSGAAGGERCRESGEKGRDEAKGGGIRKSGRIIDPSKDGLSAWLKRREIPESDLQCPFIDKQSRNEDGRGQRSECHEEDGRGSKREPLLQPVLVGAPDVDTQSYSEMKIEEFGMALLRGMGYKKQEHYVPFYEPKGNTTNPTQNSIVRSTSRRRTSKRRTKSKPKSESDSVSGSESNTDSDSDSYLDSDSVSESEPASGSGSGSKSKSREMGR